MNIETNIAIRSRKGFLALAIVIIGLVAFYALQAIEPQLQFIGVFVLLLGLGISSWYLIDRYCFTKVSLQDEILKKNSSMAFAFLGYIILIAIAELCAFAVFFTLKQTP